MAGIDLMKEGFDIFKTVAFKLHLCNTCTNTNCPYAERIIKANNIINSHNENLENIIVEKLGPNPNKGSYARVNYHVGPIVKCDKYEGVLLEENSYSLFKDNKKENE